MKKLATTAVLVLAFQSAALPALSLVPHEIARVADGPSLKRYFFEDGKKHLTFRLDSKMTVDGGGETVGFRFEDLNHALMKLSHSRSDATLPFDEKNLAAYRSSALNLLGADATAVQIEEERPNAIAINGWTSHQIVFAYELFGMHYRRSITFLNYSPTEQLIVDVCAPAEDYVKAYARGYRVLNSITDVAITNDGPT